MAAMLILVQGTAMARSFNVGNDHFTHHNDFFDNKGFFGGFDQDINDTGDVNISTRISQRGNTSNQSAAPLQFANTGNFQNAQGFVQVDSTADDVEFEGGSF